jgi:mono/diheme cytochrome c family protein
MKISRVIVVVAAATGLTSFGSTAYADAAAGKATFEGTCAECHEAADFEGESAQDLSTKIKGIVAGTQKHKQKLTLTDQQVADVAAFMAAGGK